MSERRDRPSAEPEQGTVFGLDEIGHFTSLELDEVVDYLAERFARLHVFSRLAIYLVDEQRRRLEVVRDSIASGSSVEGTGDPLFLTPRTDSVGHHYSLDSEVAAAIVVATPEIVELAHDVLAPDEDDHGEDDDATISCLIPVRRGAQVLAVAVGSCPAESRDGLLERLEDLSPLLRRVAVALGNALLYRRVRESEHSARVSLSLQTVRNAILSMESARNWVGVLNALYRELGRLVNFHECSISLLEDDDIVHGYYWEAGQSYYEYRIPTPDPIARAIESAEPIYRRDVQELKKSGEERMVDRGVRSLVDVPFARGTLAMNSVDENAFSESDIDVLCQFASVMSEAHRRLQDLEALGVKDRELQQSQKMEAVGQLTAGIAHNFNNMLQGVIGNLELALVKATPEIRDGPRERHDLRRSRHRDGPGAADVHAPGHAARAAAGGRPQGPRRYRGHLPAHLRPQDRHRRGHRRHPRHPRRLHAVAAGFSESVHKCPRRPRPPQPGPAPHPDRSRSSRARGVGRAR